MEQISDLPDVSHICGSSRDDDARAAYEHYRTAFDLALAWPSVWTYREVVLAYDKLLDITEGAPDDDVVSVLRSGA